MHNQESVLENDTYKFFWDFDILTDLLISARRPDFIIIIKDRTCRIVDVAVPPWPQSKIETMRKKGLVPWTCKGIEKTVEHERDDYTNCNWFSCYNHQRISSRTGGFRNNRTGGDCPIFCRVKIYQDTEKSPGDLRRLAVTQTVVENHLLRLLWKTLME